MAVKRGSARLTGDGKVLTIKPTKCRKLIFYTPNDLVSLRLCYLEPQFYRTLEKATHDGFIDEWLSKHGLKDVVEKLGVFKKKGFQEYLQAFRILFKQKEKQSQELVPVGDYFKKMDKLFSFFKKSNENYCKILLYGPPGCGKTASAKYFSFKHGLKFIPNKSSYFHHADPDGDYGEFLFERVRLMEDCVLMIDELDAVGGNREDAPWRSANDSILMELDGVHENPFLFVGASNMPWLLDQALLRSGRIDYCFYVPTPNYEERLQILELYAKKYACKADFNEIAGMTDYYSCADLKTLCHKAFLNASMEEATETTAKHFITAARENPSTALGWFEHVSQMGFTPHYAQRFREWHEAVKEFKAKRAKAGEGQALLSVS